MRAHEFLENLRPIGAPIDTLNEIQTVDELLQPNEEYKRRVADMANTPVDGFKNIFWGMVDDKAVVASKVDNTILGYTVLVKLENKKSKEFPHYICPKNLYSWTKDGGVTALNLIKASIRLAGELPVMSDIQLSPSAKRFLQKNVECGALTGKVFNLSTGKVTPYDLDIWTKDDDYRILFMEHMGITYPNKLIVENTWNWSSTAKIRRKCPF